MMIDTILVSLQQSGHRDTRPRRAIVEVIVGRQGAFTAREIVAEMAPHGFGRATVYRTLAALQSLGYVTRLHVGPECDRYTISDGSHHHHLVCTACGAVFPIAGCEVEQAAHTVARRIGFAVDGHHLDVYGRCATCGVRRRSED
ncbi:MAG: transcriptional repressor [Chloroflexi bacterium]|nr:transcriptional repressor [Chloroflexota bacterium]